MFDEDNKQTITEELAAVFTFGFINNSSVTPYPKLSDHQRESIVNYGFALAETYIEEVEKRREAAANAS